MAWNIWVGGGWLDSTDAWLRRGQSMVDDGYIRPTPRDQPPHQPPHNKPQTNSYGDGGPDSCRWHSPEEVALREHVYAVNKRCAEARAAAGVLPAPPAGMAAGGKHQHH